MYKLLQNTNVSLLLLLVIILVLLFLIWYLIKDKQNKLKVSVEDYNKLINQIRELQIENKKLKQHQELKNINPVKINPSQIEEDYVVNKSKEEKQLFNGNFSELIEEFRKGNSKKLFELLIAYLHEESDEFYEALNIESKWRTIQNFKIEGTVDASSLILEETKISKSTLLLIQKIKNAAPNIKG